MSRFFSEKFNTLTPYTPGEQPRDQQYIKLNTNESPFPPSPKAQLRAAEEAGKLQLYSDPQCRDLVTMAAEKLGVAEDEILFGNGSDEILSFAMRAFCGAGKGVAFADITYGFYPVWAALYGLDARIIPLNDDYEIDIIQKANQAHPSIVKRGGGADSIRIREIQADPEYNTP